MESGKLLTHTFDTTLRYAEINESSKMIMARSLTGVGDTVREWGGGVWDVPTCAPHARLSFVVPLLELRN